MNNIIKSILSGILISIGGTVYLSSINSGVPWFGAILFSAGLFTICEYGYNLYTGKVGYIGFHFKDVKYIGLVLLICLFNILTTFVLGFLMGKNFTEVAQTAQTIYEKKLNASLVKAFVSSVFCGILMFLAVDTWKRGKKIGVFLYVPVFIICGFDHSIANSFYNGASFASGSSLTFSFSNLIFILLVVLGNGLGGITFPVLTRFLKEEK